MHANSYVRMCGPLSTYVQSLTELCTTMYQRTPSNWLRRQLSHLAVPPGTADSIFPIAAVIEGGSLSEIYEKVKSTISEQSGQHVWLPSDEAI